MMLGVTEHVVKTKFCPNCGAKVRGEFPEEVSAPTQYGPHFGAGVAYLLGYQLMPFGRCAELIEEIFGIKVSQGTLARIRTKVAKAVAPSVEAVGEVIKLAKVVGFDETGMRNMGEREWLHVACTMLATYYFPHEQRGRIAMNEMGITYGILRNGAPQPFEFLLHVLLLSHRRRRPPSPGAQVSEGGIET